MATSNRLLAYLESARNLAGCAGGAVGLVLHFTGVAGPWWPGVVAGLYGVGALLAPGPGPRGGSGGELSGGELSAGAGAGRAGGPGSASGPAAGSVLSPELEAELAAALGGDPVAGTGGSGAGPASGAGSGSGTGSGAGGGRGARPVAGPDAGRGSGRPDATALRTGIAELEAYLADADLPWSAGVDELLAELARRAGSVREEAALRAAERAVGEQLPLAVDGYLRARAWERWAAGAVDPAVTLGREVARIRAALG
ncbi:hypothetical protein [Kitasatospora sp. NPDC057015]|uniref:hypothetical protein n=1 Tax=Kitasatospora sp. NPDC057015 TaxID=3346001 RepID=UPI00363F4266